MTTFIFAMKQPPILTLHLTARHAITEAIADAHEAKEGLEDLGRLYHGMSNKVERPIEHLETLIARLERLMAYTK
jgi:hypothetical protein